MGQPCLQLGLNPKNDRFYLAFILALALIAPYTLISFGPNFNFKSTISTAPTPTAPHVAKDFEASILKCQRLHLLPGPHSKFNERTHSDRFVEGTPPTLIRNATIWTGDHEHVLKGDVLLNNGLIIETIASTSHDNSIDVKSLPINTKIVQAHGAFLTPGIFDMHSHIGVESAPALSGANDGNSISKPILPYLRSLDSINTHDASFKRSISGGITTSLVLPGSANNIGGQAFAIKLRATKEKTPQSLVLEMPFNVKSDAVWEAGELPRFRHMKMACGENIRNVYKQVRMDLAWNFRSHFEKAQTIKKNQDNYCEEALIAHSKGEVLEKVFPDDELEWEMLVDVLRGKVKVNAHCYESTDLSALIRHSNEFKFPIAALHHAHETFQVPDLLKSTFGGTPAVAIFATNGRYKREAWRGSEYAAKILNENNITVIMKSDHPVLDSRYLLFEAQQAHHFGLPENIALASITTSPARTAGFSHRIGYIRSNYDADLVLWDSHPLKLGATPLQVWIDGISQLENVFMAKELNIDVEAPEMASIPIDPITLRDDDDSFREKEEIEEFKEIYFINVNEVILNHEKKKGELYSFGEIESLSKPFSVHIKDGSIHCLGECSLPTSTSTSTSIPIIDLKGGSLLPPLIAYGPALGLTEIISESSTSDGQVYDSLISSKLSSNVGFGDGFIRAIDGLSFGGKHLKLSERMGVGKAVTAPMGDGFYRGLSVGFRVGAGNILEPNAIIKDVVAIHVTIGHYKEISKKQPSISTQIAQLRSLLLSSSSSTSSSESTSIDYFKLAAKGKIPLVINAWKADTMASIILLKREVEGIMFEGEIKNHKKLNWIIHGGQEAHLIATELAQADISVIVSPPRAFPESWDERRVLPGPPTTQRSNIGVLEKAGVRIGLGVPEEWQSMTLLWELAWVSKISNGEISRLKAISYLTSNLERMLNLPIVSTSTSASELKGGKRIEFVAHERDPFEFGSRAVAMSTRNGKKVQLLL